MEPRRDVSICVATCRRPTGLARLLDSLSKLKVPEGVSLEIVVVDNDIRESARSVVERAAQGPLELRHFVEPEPNIALARNRALREARGRWLAFIDDDEVADEGWLEAYWRQVPCDGCEGLAGPILPKLERVVTPWLAPEVFYARPRYLSRSRIDASQVRCGNAFVVRELFEERGFDAAFGRSGGEDTEFFEASRGRFFWCNEAVVHETIPPERHRLGWLARRAFRGGCVDTQLELRCGSGADALWSAARAFLAFVALGALLPVSLLLGRPMAARAWLRLCVQAGHLWALAGRSYREYGEEPGREAAARAQEA